MTLIMAISLSKHLAFKFEKDDFSTFIQDPFTTISFKVLRELK